MAITLPYTETWTGSNGSPWPTNAWSIVTQAAGTATLLNGGGLIVPPSGGYAQGSEALYGMPNIGDTDVTVEITCLNTANSQIPTIYINNDLTNLDGSGQSPSSLQFVAYISTTAASSSLTFWQGAGQLVSITKTLTLGLTYTIRFKRFAGMLYGKIWQTSTTEPSLWDLIWSLDGMTLGNGVVQLVAQNANDNNNACPMLFENLTVSVPATLPLPYTETWSGTVGTPWQPSVWTSPIYVAPSNGATPASATIQSTGGQIVPQSGASNPYADYPGVQIMYGLPVMSDTDVTVQVTGSTNSVSPQAGVFINEDVTTSVRGPSSSGGSPNSIQLIIQYNATAANSTLLLYQGANQISPSPITKSFTGTTPYMLRLRRYRGFIYGKAWAASSAEPTTWDYTVATSSLPNNTDPTGVIGLVSQDDSSGNGYAFTFSNLTVSVPKALETWTGSNGASWPSQWGQIQGNTASGAAATIQSNSGQIVSGTGGNYAGTRVPLAGIPPLSTFDMSGLVAMGASAVEQGWQVTVADDFSATTPGYGNPNNAYSLAAYYSSTASQSNITLYSFSTGSQNTLIASANRTLTGTTQYSFRIQLIGNTLRARVWATASPEPTTWDLTYIISGTPLNGVVSLGAYQGNASASRTAIYDNLIVNGATVVPYNEMWAGTSWPAWWSVPYGTATISGGGGALTAAATGTYAPARASFYDMSPMTDIDLVVTVKAVSVAAANGQSALINFSGDNASVAGTAWSPANGYGLWLDYNAIDSQSLVHFTTMVYGSQYSLTAATKTLTGGVAYNVHIQKINNLFQARVWKNGINEPFAWDVSYDLYNVNSGVAQLNGNNNPNVTVYTGIVSLGTANGNDATARTFIFDNLVISTPAPIAAPVVGFSASASNGLAPLVTTFTDTSLNQPTSWSWTFGDGGTSTAQNPSYTYALPGTYTVSLTATNNVGSTTLTQTNYMVVGTVIWNGFESGIQGATFATAGSGGGLNGTQFAARITSGGTTLTYDGTYTIQGSNMGFKITYPSSGAGYLTMSVGTVALARVSFRVWVWVPSSVSASGGRILEVRDTGNLQDAQISVTNTGTSYFGTGTTTGATTSATFPTNQWVMLVGAVTTGASAGAGIIEYAAYAATNLSTALWNVTRTSAALASTNAIGSFYIGASNGAASAYAINYDDLYITDTLQTGFPGPRVAPVTLPYTETWTGPTGNPWPAPWVGKTANSIIQNNSGVLSPSTGNDAGIVLAGMPIIGNVDVIVSFTPSLQTTHAIIVGIDDDGTSTGSGGNQFGLQILVNSTPASSNLQFFYGLSGANAIAGTATKTIYTGVQYTVRFQRIGSSLRTRLWQANTTEPTAWDLIYTYSGTIYTGYVRLGISNTSNPVTFDSLTVSIPTGSASFTATPLTGSASLAVTFTDTSTNAPTAWSWTFGDGGTSTSQNPSYTYTKPGNYTVSLTATGTPTNAATYTNFITVGTIIANSFEGGTQGTTVSTANSGGVSGTPFTSVVKPAGTIIQYDTSHPAQGSGMGMLETFSATAGYTTTSISTTIGSRVTFRIWVFARSSDLSGSLRIAQVMDTGGASIGFLNYNSNGTVWFGPSNAQGAVSPAAVPMNQNILFQGAVTSAATDGNWVWELTAFAATDLTTPLFSVTKTGSTAGSTSAVGVFRLGNSQTSFSWSMWYDDFYVTDSLTTGFPGPSISPVTLPFAESFSGGSGVSWSQSWAQVQSNGSGGSALLQNGTGVISPGTSTYAQYRVILGAMPAITDTELFTTFVATYQNEQYMHFGLNVDGSTLSGTPWMSNNGYFLQVTVNPNPSLSLYTLYANNNGTSTTAINNTSFTINAGTQYNLRFQRNGTILRFKIWQTAGNEPGPWTTQYVDNGTQPAANQVMVGSGNGNSTTPMTMVLSNLTVSRFTAPIVSFTAAPITGMAPLTSTFTDTSGNSPTSWSWDFGDGGTSAIQNPSHTFANPGSYTITLTASNSTGSNSVTKVAFILVPKVTDMPALVGHSEVNPGFSGASTHLLSPDTTIAPGDWMIIVVPTYVAITSGPGGSWTTIQQSITAGTLYTSIFAKKYSASDTLPYVITFPTNGNQTYSSSLLFWGTGGGDPSTWVIGNNMLRGNISPTTTFNNVAPSVTAPSVNNLAIIVSTERTNASETDISSISGATEWYFMAQQNTNAIQTVMIGSIQQAAAGATGDVTVVYPNTQSVNGMARQILISAPYVTLPYTETWTGTNGSAWPGVWASPAAVAGTATIQSNQGALAPLAGSYNAYVQDLVGMPLIGDTDLVVSIVGSSTGVDQHASISINIDHANVDGLAQSPYSFTLDLNYSATPAAGALTIYQGNNSNAYQVGTTAPKTLVGSTSYTARLRRYNGFIYAKVWPTASTEPGTWDITASLSTATLQPGVVALGAQNVVNGTAYVFNYDNMTVSVPTSASAAAVTIPYFQTFTGTNGANLPGEWRVIDGTATIQSNQAQLVPPASAYSASRVDLAGMLSLTDTEVLVQITGTAAGVIQYAGIGINSDPTDDSYSGTSAYAIKLMLQYDVTASNSNIAIYQGNFNVSGAVTKTLTGTTPYMVRLRRSAGTVYGRVWAASAAEPTSWDIGAAIAGFPYSTNPSGVVTMNAQNGNNTSARTFNFTNLQVWVPQAVETWTGSNGASWPSVWSADQGNTTIQSNAGQLISPGSASSASRAILTSAYLGPAFEIYVTITGTINSVFQTALIGTGDSSDLSANGAGMSGFTFEMDYNSSSASSSISLLHSSNVLAGPTTVSLTGTTAYRVHLQGFGNTVRAKIWPLASAEPSAWTLSTTTAFAFPRSQYAALVAVTPAGVTGARTFNFDDLIVNGNPQGSTTAPYVQTFDLADSSPWPGEWLDYGVGSSTVISGAGQIAVVSTGSFYGKALSQSSFMADQDVQIDVLQNDLTHTHYNYVEIKSSQIQSGYYTSAGYAFSFGYNGTSLYANIVSHSNYSGEQLLADVSSVWQGFDLTKYVHVDFSASLVSGGNLLQLYIWQGSSKPAVPTVSTTDSQYNNTLASGGLMLYQANTASTSPTTRFDNIKYGPYYINNIATGGVTGAWFNDPSS